MTVSKCPIGIGFCWDWATLLTDLTGFRSNSVQSSVWRHITATDSAIGLVTHPGAWLDTLMSHSVFYCSCLLHYLTALQLQSRSGVFGLASCEVTSIPLFGTIHTETYVFKCHLKLPQSVSQQRSFMSFMTVKEPSALNLDGPKNLILTGRRNEAFGM